MEPGEEPPSRLLSPPLLLVGVMSYSGRIRTIRRQSILALPLQFFESTASEMGEVDKNNMAALYNCFCYLAFYSSGEQDKKRCLSFHHAYKFKGVYVVISVKRTLGRGARER